MYNHTCVYNHTSVYNHIQLYTEEITNKNLACENRGKPLLRSNLLRLCPFVEEEEELKHPTEDAIDKVPVEYFQTVQSIKCM